jgi:catechol 2,3-dioxygenase-like lactoylglutathione lyase family enzyme
MQIKLTSLMVNDQARAREFYTKKLGFTIKQDDPIGEFNWLTVVSPEGHDDMEMLLEPTNFPPARVYQQALYDAGIAATGFFTDDIHGEYERLKKLGVEFTDEPAKMGPATVATFDDTCGNLIKLYQI